MKMDVTTGAVQRLVDGPGMGAIGAWNKQDVILLSGRGGLRRVSAQGAAPEAVTHVDETRGEIGHFLPTLLPGGRRFLYPEGGSNDGCERHLRRLVGREA